MKKLYVGRYDFAACMIFVVYALTSTVIPMCLVPLAVELGFPLDDGGMGLGGALQAARSIPMVVTLVVSGFVAGLWGKRMSLGWVLVIIAAGMCGCALAPTYAVLFVALCLAGFGEGIIEGLATPFVQDLHPTHSGRYMNLCHSFWGLGIVLLVLSAGLLLSLGVSWRLIVLATGLSSLVPALVLLWPNGGEKRLIDERMHWRDVCGKTRDILKVRRFWLFFLAMFFAGGAEFCLIFWSASFIQLEFAGTAWAAGAGMACFASGMFAGRFVPGLLVSQKNLKKLIVILALAGALVTLCIPWLTSQWTLFPVLFLAGLAMGPFWPSIQSDGAVRVKGDYTVMMILFSCSGVPGSAFFAAVLGVMGDWVGMRASFLLVPLCFLGVFVPMCYDMLSDSRDRQPSEMPLG